MTLGDLNTLAVPAARDALMACCASTRWVEQVLNGRPYASRAALHRTSDDAWRQLSPADIDAAIAHHPRIGEAPRASAGDSRASEWARAEQGSLGGTAGSGTGATAVAGDPRGVLEALAQGNRDYERRFGRLFIVCASGLSAGEILTLLRSRLQNDLQTEITATSDELRKITALRLDKLISET